MSTGTSPRRELILLAASMVLAMSTWFSTAAVLGQLRIDWDLSRAQASWLTIVVQLGFVAGALTIAFTNLADRVPPRRLIFIGASGAALCNLAVIAGDSFGVGIAARLGTGAFLAAVYPPALKAMSAWFRRGRGLALGVMVGALTVGSALPHLVNAVGGFDWQPTLAVVSALTFAGGLIALVACTDGPYAVGTAPFDPSQLRAIVTNRGFRLASFGYFGHMWELYAMWAWIAAFYGDVFTSPRTASFVAFLVIAIGAAGSIYGGLTSDRTSRAEAAGLAMRWSAAAAFVIGFLVDAPQPVVIAVGLVWGFWVIADSAQFSAIVSERVAPRYVGTALTLQLAAGFVLTVFTIFLVPTVESRYGWGWAFMLLVPGPLLGSWAMRALRVGPRRHRRVEPAKGASVF
ncbi:MAG: MFS transporter [Actinomycetota bacterium]